MVYVEQPWVSRWSLDLSCILVFFVQLSPCVLRSSEIDGSDAYK